MDDKGSSGMDTEAIAKVLGAIVSAIVLLAAIVFGPIGQMGKPAREVQKIELPQPVAPVAPAAPVVRGPVVRELAQ